MRIPPPSPTRRLIVLIAATLVLAVGCRYEEVGGVGTRTADDEHPPQADVELVGCRTGDLSRWHATVTITNHTPEVQTYEVTIGFYDDEIRLAQRSHWVRALRPGEVAEIDPSWWIESPDRVSDCRLLTVNRFA